MPLLDQPVRHRAAHVPGASASSGSTSSASARRRCSSSQPPQGLRRQGARARQAEVDRRLAAEGRSRSGALPGGRPRPATTSTSTGCRSSAAGRATAAPFITLPAVITKRPAHGRAQRRHVPDAEASTRARPGMHWQIHKDGARRPARRARGERLDGRGRASAATRSPPTRRRAPLPSTSTSCMFAGFLRGEPVEMVKCLTVDLEVPANAEIVLEGYVEPGERRRRGAVRRPHRLLHAGRAVPGASTSRAITMRRDPIYPSIVVGKPPPEDALARQGDRADLPAADPDDRAGDRRLRPAGRRASSTTA